MGLIVTLEVKWEELYGKRKSCWQKRRNNGYALEFYFWWAARSANAIWWNVCATSLKSQGKVRKFWRAKWWMHFVHKEHPHHLLMDMCFTVWGQVKAGKHILEMIQRDCWNQNSERIYRIRSVTELWGKTIISLWKRKYNYVRIT